MGGVPLYLGGVPGGHLADLKAEDPLEIRAPYGVAPQYGGPSLSHRGIWGGPSFWGALGGFLIGGGPSLFGGGSRGGTLLISKPKTSSK